MNKQHFASVFAVVLALYSLLAACARTSPNAFNSSTVTATQTSHEVMVGSGIACRLSSSAVGPTSYAAQDVGKPGLPKVSPKDLATLKRIIRTAGDPTLRFAYVMGEFIVYDAFNGPCAGMVRYRVINGACNEFYEPYDIAYNTSSAMGPGCLNPTPQPK